MYLVSVSGVSFEGLRDIHYFDTELVRHLNCRGIDSVSSLALALGISNYSAEQVVGRDFLRYADAMCLGDYIRCLEFLELDLAWLAAKVREAKEEAH